MKGVCVSDRQERATTGDNPSPDVSKPVSGAVTVIAGGCGLFLLICIGIFIWGSIQGPSTKTTTKPTEMVHMQGSVTVFDQRTCADGPMLRISAGSYGPVPLKFSSGNAPCRLLVNTKIEKATRYKFEVRPLPPVIRNADQIQKNDGSLEVDVSLRP